MARDGLIDGVAVIRESHRIGCEEVKHGRMDPTDPDAARETLDGV